MTDNRSTAHAREGQQHTPGPWEYDSDGHVYVEQYPDLDAAEPHITRVNMTRYDGEENARLIVAAPDLLQAARYALELISTARNYFPKSIQNRDRFQLENINAAIGTAVAKAEGL